MTNSNTTRSNDLLRSIEDGLRQTRALLDENQQLRSNLENREKELESLRAAVTNDPNALSFSTELDRLRTEKDEMAARLRQAESENEAFARRYVEIEDENNNLANLYIASYQLHSTLDFDEVLRNILEIVINLVGAEEFGIYLVHPDTNELQPVAAEGVSLSELPNIATDTSLGSSMVAGTPIIRDRFGYHDMIDFGAPVAAIPLRLKDELLGVIMIYRMLQHKDGFTDVDRELFTLLAGHAATALFAARLYGESKRKLSTIQGFLDMLTK